MRKTRRSCRSYLRMAATSKCFPFPRLREARDWCARVLFGFGVFAVESAIDSACDCGFSSCRCCWTRIAPRIALTAYREEEEYESSEGYDDEEDEEDEDDEEEEVERKLIAVY
jgi:hypothetical protein